MNYTMVAIKKALKKQYKNIQIELIQFVIYNYLTINFIYLRYVCNK